MNITRINHKNGEVSLRMSQEHLEKLSALCGLARGHDLDLNDFVKKSVPIPYRKYRCVDDYADGARKLGPLRINFELR